MYIAGDISINVVTLGLSVIDEMIGEEEASSDLYANANKTMETLTVHDREENIENFNKLFQFETLLAPLEVAPEGEEDTISDTFDEDGYIKEFLGRMRRYNIIPPHFFNPDHNPALKQMQENDPNVDTEFNEIISNYDNIPDPIEDEDFSQLLEGPEECDEEDKEEETDSLLADGEYEDIYNFYFEAD